jgi:hypothetical protein
MDASFKMIINDSPFAETLTAMSNQLDYVTKNCESVSTKTGDSAKLYECGISHLIGKFSIILYVTTLALKADGVNINNINSLREVLAYTGFATLKTRIMLKNLNDNYSKLIEIDNRFVKHVSPAYDLIKAEILKNNSSPTQSIFNRLPRTLSGD